MGNKPAAAKSVSAQTSVEFDLLQSQIQALFRFKILILGEGESGKSTIVKQLKLLHQQAPTDKETEVIITSLHQNIVDCMKALCLAAKTFNIYPMTPEDQATVEFVLDMPENTRLSPEQGDAVFRLWGTQAIQHAYSQREKFWMLDSFPYYIKHIQRFIAKGFRPTEEDTVMARIRTTGIITTDLDEATEPNPNHSKDPNEPKSLNFQVVDVGGQRSERKKWMNCFDDVRAVIYCVNLAGYNQVLFEDQSRNRMVESLELFQRVVTNPVFKDTPIFLFLNKLDLFETQIREVDLKRAFPEYEGGCDYKHAMEYIVDQFKAQGNSKQVIVKPLSASSRRDVRAAFDDVKHTLYDSNRESILTQVAVLKSEQEEVAAKMKKEEEKSSGCC